MSADPEQEYFSDGIAEELLNLLAKIPELKVISRTSAFSYKGKDVPLRQVASELGVAHILEGSVRKAGKRVRITTQLIDARSDTQLWSETYDRTLHDVFAIQDEIAGDVVGRLEVTLLGQVQKTEEVDPEAYALILQARHMSRLGSAEGEDRAVTLLQNALAISPNYARAWNSLATVYTSQARMPGYSLDERYALAREAVTKALIIDPHIAETHSGLGWLAMFADGDLAAAADHFRRALQLDPGNANLIGNAATLVSELGRSEEAIPLREYAVDRDPLSPKTHLGLAMTLAYARRWEEVLAPCQSALTLSPDLVLVHFLKGWALLMLGDAAAALDEVSKDTNDRVKDLGTAMALHALGRRDEANVAREAFAERWGQPVSRSPRPSCTRSGATSMRPSNAWSGRWTSRGRPSSTRSCRYSILFETIPAGYRSSRERASRPSSSPRSSSRSRCRDRAAESPPPTDTHRHHVQHAQGS